MMPSQELEQLQSVIAEFSRPGKSDGKMMEAATKFISAFNVERCAELIEYIAELKHDLYEHQKLLQSLLNKVNVVTSAYRHQKIVSEGALSQLSERQIRVEQQLAGLQKGTPDGK